MNVITLAGRLGADPEIAFYDSGSNKTSFSLYVKPYPGAPKEKDFIVSCHAWGKVGEVIANYVKSGDQIIITGNLDKNAWVDGSGNARSTFFVNVSQMEFGAKGRHHSEEEFVPQSTQPSSRKVVSPVYDF